MNARLEANLIRLSLQNVTGKREPRVYDNDTRARIFRAARPSPRQNEYDWPHCKKAREKARAS